MKEHSVKHDHGKLMEAKRAVELVSACRVSIEQAMAVIVSSIGGTVFDLKLKKIDDRLVWRVKLVRDGARVKAYIDARSGLVLEAKAEVGAAEPHEVKTADPAHSACPTAFESTARY